MPNALLTGAPAAKVANANERALEGGCKLAMKCATRNVSAKGRDRPFDSSVKVWLMAIDKDID